MYSFCLSLSHHAPMKSLPWSSWLPSCGFGRATDRSPPKSSLPRQDDSWSLSLHSKAGCSSHGHCGGLHWAPPRLSEPFLYWHGAMGWVKQDPVSRYAPVSTEQREKPLHHICWLCPCQCSPGLCQLSLPPACAAASTRVTYSLPALPHPFQQPVAPQSVLFNWLGFGKGFLWLRALIRSRSHSFIIIKLCIQYSYKKVCWYLLGIFS